MPGVIEPNVTATETGGDTLRDLPRLSPSAFVEDCDCCDRGFENVFVIGSLDRRVTFKDQQTRALNLAYSLVETGIANDQTRIAVIGAGLAGITFSAAMTAISQAEIVLFEKNSRPLDHQVDASHRWLHPNIYDWPMAGWQVQNAGLPIMNWSADTASDVIEKLREQAKAFLATGRVRFVGSTTNIKVSEQANGWRVKALQLVENGSNTINRLANVDVVVLAVGFGEEDDASSDAASGATSSRSYWCNDGIANLTAGQWFVVSGTGDGGLIDVVRLLFQDFRHDKLANLLADSNLAEVRREINSLEMKSSRLLTPSIVTDAYQSLAKRVPQEFLTTLRSRLRPGVTGILCHRTEYPFDRRASAANRFLVSCLLELAAGGSPGGLSARSCDLEWKQIGRHYQCKFDGQPHHVAREFAAVVLRYGPAPSALSKVWPELDSKLTAERERRQRKPELCGMSRAPIWDDAFARTLRDFWQQHVEPANAASVGNAVQQRPGAGQGPVATQGPSASVSVAALPNHATQTPFSPRTAARADRGRTWAQLHVAGRMLRVTSSITGLRSIALSAPDEAVPVSSDDTVATLVIAAHGLSVARGYAHAIEVGWVDRYSGAITPWPEAIPIPRNYEDCRLLAITTFGNSSVRLVVTTATETIVMNATYGNEPEFRVLHDRPSRDAIFIGVEPVTIDPDGRIDGASWPNALGMTFIDGIDVASNIGHHLLAAVGRVDGVVTLVLTDLRERKISKELAASPRNVMVVRDGRAPSLVLLEQADGSLTRHSFNL